MEKLQKSFRAEITCKQSGSRGCKLQPARTLEGACRATANEPITLKDHTYFDLVLRFFLFAHCLLIAHTSLPAIAKCAEASSFVVVSLTFYVLKFFMVSYLVKHHSHYLCQPGRKCRTSDLKLWKLGEDL